MRVGAGSRMLSRVPSLIDSTIAERLARAGYTVAGRAEVGEFSIDLSGETSTDGAHMRDGAYVTHAAELLLDGKADACVVLDVNGAPRRAAAQWGLACIKPTYGCVSTYGVTSAAPSGETVAVMGRTARACREVLDAISGFDVRDGKSVPEGMRTPAQEEILRVLIPTELSEGLDGEMGAELERTANALRSQGVSVTYTSMPWLEEAHAAWNTVLCADLSKSTARYDGVRFGHRSEKSSSLDGLYTNSRGEGFGTLLKCAILYGSEVVSPENYDRLFRASLCVRTQLTRALEEMTAEHGALLLPATSVRRYTDAWCANCAFPAFEENRYTASASLTGLPAIVFGGVQLVGARYSEDALLLLAERMEKGGDV
jgi:aspartyl-tRNA(Asn)/glutamyl-tRNA(Gln) amidotransferase subunit A